MIIEKIQHAVGDTSSRMWSTICRPTICMVLVFFVNFVYTIVVSNSLSVFSYQPSGVSSSFSPDGFSIFCMHVDKSRFISKI